jgi:putative CocE/NonD family hydrolase
MNLVLLGIIIFLQSNTIYANDFIIKSDVKIQMSDGTNLLADIYLPDSLQKYPTVLIRNPYNKDYLKIFGETIVKYGYAVVLQDVRGKYGSEGIFTVFADEKQDGLDTLDWIVEQPWCDGNIGIYGPSYLSYCGLILAPENHKALKTIVNSSGIADIYELMYISGTYNQTMAIWMKRQGLGRIDYNGIFSIRPLNKMVDSILEPHARTIMNHDTKDLFYKKMSIYDSYNKIKIPILHSTGWNDYMYRNTLNAYKEISKTNSKQKIFIGPWTHNEQLNAESSSYGEEDFGPNSLFGFEKDMKVSMRWFEYHLKGIENGIMDEPLVEYFVMGSNKWKKTKQFPPENTNLLSLYLNGSKANSSNGDGTLVFKREKIKGSDTFIYDPENPAPTVGGVNSHMMPSLAGIKNQAEIEQRNDILVYTSNPFKNDTEIVGDIVANLFISSSSIDTDFTAKLVELRPDGYARIIEDGIAKTRFREGFEKKVTMIPGSIYEIEIKIGTTAILIPKGHRIRLEISSSNFPKYPRNANTGIKETDAVNYVKAKQTIYHSPKFPSRLVLPVVNFID